MNSKSFLWYYFRTFIKPQSTFELLLNNEKYFRYGFIYILLPLIGYTLMYIFLNIKLIGKDNTIYMFDLKTAKPNMGGFKEFKRTLLEWIAATLAIDPTVNVNSFIAIPYNPEAPKQYARWTMAGMIDIKNELKVADELWDFIGGDGTYLDLLDIFERIGVELRPEIDEYFSKYNKYKS